MKKIIKRTLGVLLTLVFIFALSYLAAEGDFITAIIISVSIPILLLFMAGFAYLLVWLFEL